MDKERAKLGLPIEMILSMGARANNVTAFNINKPLLDYTIKWKQEYFPEYFSDAWDDVFFDKIRLPRYNTPCDVRICTGTYASTIMDLFDHGESICILDSASAEYPCEGFFTNPFSQEGEICSISSLYPVLSSSALEPFYEYNKRHQRNYLYDVHGVYLPRVPFTTETGDMTYNGDVIAMAPPLYQKAVKLGATNEELEKMMVRHLRAIFRIVRLHDAENLVLGLYGVDFHDTGYNVDFIVSCYVKLISFYLYQFKRIVVVIPEFQGKIRDRSIQIFKERGYKKYQ